MENISLHDEENEDIMSDEHNGIQYDSEINMDKSVQLFSSSGEEDNDDIDKDIASKDDEEEQNDIEFDINGSKNRKRIILLDDSDDEDNKVPESEQSNTAINKGSKFCYHLSHIKSFSYFC